ncbi:phage Gp37/Gp68 family protein [Cupriavidus alkaliphilus]|uniref:Protein gp37 n=1 Tax=Cupriavidus alkaliphilus TaxID=942866 RepID=A0A7W4V6J2_9BURK|nr:phage Gp37/Gp68 family protein [Cupriavidus alkaliphilus]MBB3006021.1 protein gp37 [Cupriavidus alkaliphilus]
MSENSKIEWTDHTFNPWEGCQKVGPGCDHCYAETRNARFAGGVAVNWGPGAPRRRTSPANWRKPIQWNARHDAFFAAHGRRQRVFCASLADVFDNAVGNTWRAELLALIWRTPNLDWLLLTKRIGNVPALMEECTEPGKDWELPPNVWLGATITSQAEADRDVPKLLATPARVRFLSMEPLLGPVDLLKNGDTLCRCDGCLRMASEYPESAGLQRIDWVIVGGESGAGARPMHPDWARSLRDQCAAAGVPFLFKQWGEWRHMDVEEQRSNLDAVVRGRTTAWPDGTIGFGDFRANGGYGKPIFRLGKKAAGRLLDGVQHDGFPARRAP